MIYHKELMVDCGVPFARLEKYHKDIKLVLLTHRHKDHINNSTFQRLLKERPSIIFGIPKHMLEYFEYWKINVPKKNMFILEANKVYKFNNFTISPFNLYHDVPNFGYRIINNKTGHKTFHATDTRTLSGIAAKHYDLYMIEANYDAETIDDVITQKLANHEYSYEIRAIQNHLSFQQSRAFFERNKHEGSEYVKLHVSNRYTDAEVARF